MSALLQSFLATDPETHINRRVFRDRRVQDFLTEVDRRQNCRRFDESECELCGRVAVCSLFTAFAATHHACESCRTEKLAKVAEFNAPVAAGDLDAYPMVR